MKRLWGIIFITALLFSGCSGESTAVFNADAVLSQTDFDIMYADPNSKKGESVDFNGVVFSVERSDEKSAMQVMSDIENYDKSIIVYYEDNDSNFKENDLVNVQGLVEGAFEGENMMGAALTMPMIISTKVELTDYKTAVRPTVKELVVDQVQTQHDFTIEVEKIEFAEEETRVYVRATNDSSDNISFYSFNSKLIQGKKQYEEEGNYEADYPEIQSDLSPSIESEGVIVYGPITDNENIKLIFEAYSDDYEKDFELFTFDINMN